MEMQYFVKPGTQMDSMEKWKELRWNWHKNNGIREEMMRWEPHPEDKLAHYADAATDIEYLFPNGWGEMEGVHSRTDFDLGQHQEFSEKTFNMLISQMEIKNIFLSLLKQVSVVIDPFWRFYVILTELKMRVIRKRKELF